MKLTDGETKKKPSATTIFVTAKELYEFFYVRFLIGCNKKIDNPFVNNENASHGLASENLRIGDALLQDGGAFRSAWGGGGQVSVNKVREVVPQVAYESGCLLLVCIVENAHNWLNARKRNHRAPNQRFRISLCRGHSVSRWYILNFGS